MVVRSIGAGHVRAHLPAVTLGVVLVLDAHVAAERRHGEARDIACREHVLAAIDPTEGIDDDPVPDRQPGFGGKFDVRLDPDSGHNRAGLELRPSPSTTRPCSIPVTDEPGMSSTPRPR